MKIPGRTVVTILRGADNDDIKRTVRESGVPKPHTVKVKRDGDLTVVSVAAPDVDL